MLKNRVIPFLLLMLLPACKPNTDERARDLILHYCDINYRHYQPIEFSKPVEYYVPYQLSDKAIGFTGLEQTLKRQKDSLHRLIAKQNKPIYLLQADSVSRALDSLSEQQIGYRQSYKAERRGWYVIHSYNHEALNGALVRSTRAFVIDINYKNILETYNK